LLPHDELSEAPNQTFPTFHGICFGITAEVLSLAWVTIRQTRTRFPMSKLLVPSTSTNSASRLNAAHIKVTLAFASSTVNHLSRLAADTCCQEVGLATPAAAAKDSHA
jgi:hypothetical protein